MKTIVNNIFDKIASIYNLNIDQKNQVVADFVTALIFNLFANGKDFDSQELENIKQSIEQGNIQRALGLLKADTSEEQWGKYLQEQIERLLGDYIENVIIKK